jgi:hypothetical protein
MSQQSGLYKFEENSGLRIPQPTEVRTGKIDMADLTIMSVTRLI